MPHRWLQTKRVQAKEEAVKKDYYKALFFSQPRKLKEHTALTYVYIYTIISINVGIIIII